MKAEYINHMGSDLDVVNAARVSFANESGWEDCDAWGFMQVKHPDKPLTFVREDCGMAEYGVLKEKDVKLIRYLAKHNHWSPFAHTAIKLRMSAPVPIRTQCFKHKQGFVENEESRRYINSRPELFIPDCFRSAPVGNVKQGSGGLHPYSNSWLRVYEYQCNKAINLYEQMIKEGVAPEQARLILPQGVEVNWIWTGNLYSFANFYNKRSDAHAQKEIQDLAAMVDAIIRPLFPVSWSALVDKE